MKGIERKKASGLTKDKKEMLKKLMGSASSEKIDFNKVRNYFYEKCTILENKDIKYYNSTDELINKNLNI